MGNVNSKKSFVGKPFQYSDAVQYQSGGIVSRTLIDRKKGSVTVFAFDQDQKLSEHTAPFDALIEVVEGQAVITIDGDDHEVTSGHQIIMPANIPHAVRAYEKFKMVLIMIRE